MIHEINSYINLGIYIFIWSIVCYNHYKRVKFSSGFIVIASYLIYGILALLLYSDDLLGMKYGELKLFPFVYLFMMMYIFLTPVFKYERSNVIGTTTPSLIIIQCFIIIYSFCALVMLPSMISSIGKGLVLLLADPSGGQELYMESKDNYTIRSKGISGVFGLISIIYNIFSDIAKFIFFYYLTLKNKKYIYIILFWIVIIIDLLYGMSKGGRTDVIMNIFSSIMALTLFYPFYTNKIKRISKISVLTLLIIISIPFMVLTISRFGERDYGTTGGMLSYSGQAPLNFNTKALNAGGTRNGDRTANLFKQFIDNSTPKDIVEVRYKYRHLKLDDSLFSTYVGDFVLDYGPIGAAAILIIISIYFRSKVKIYKKTISFRSLFLIYFVLCISMQGGMYLFYYSFMENLTIMAFIFTYFIFYIDAISKNNNNYLYKEL